MRSTMKAMWVLLVVSLVACDHADREDCQSPKVRVYGGAIDLERICITDREAYIGCYEESLICVDMHRCCHSLELGIVYCMSCWGKPGATLLSEGWSIGKPDLPACRIFDAESESEVDARDPQ